MMPARQSVGMLIAGMVSLHAGAAAATGPLAYTHASSQLDAQANPMRYHPLNLLDYNATTSWCEGKEGAQSGESVTFVFKAPQTVNRIVVTGSSQSGRRVDSIRLTDSHSIVRIALTPETTDIQMTSALHGTAVTLTIDHVGEAQPESPLGADVVCLADVQLYHNDELLTPGERVTDSPKSSIVGSWNAEPLGAPERQLVFALDGTWTWTYKPLLGGPTKEVTGTYQFRGQHLLMRRGTNGAWVDVGLHQKRVTVDQQDLGAPLGDYDVIQLSSALGKDFGGDYNDAHF